MIRKHSSSEDEEDVQHVNNCQERNESTPPPNKRECGDEGKGAVFYIVITCHVYFNAT